MGSGRLRGISAVEFSVVFAAEILVSFVTFYIGICIGSVDRLAVMFSTTVTFSGLVMLTGYVWFSDFSGITTST